MPSEDLTDTCGGSFAREGVAEVVVGVPKTLGGEVGPQARRVLDTLDLPETASFPACGSSSGTSGSRPAWPSQAEVGKKRGKKRPRARGPPGGRPDAAGVPGEEGGPLRRYDKSKRRGPGGARRPARRAAVAQEPGSRAQAALQGRARRLRPVAPGGRCSGRSTLIYTSRLAGTATTRRTSPVQVEVVKGDTLSSVATKLEEAGVIKSAFVFKAQARIEGYGDGDKDGPLHVRARAGQRADPREADRRARPSRRSRSRSPRASPSRDRGHRRRRHRRLGGRKFEAAARETDYGYAFLEDPGIKTTEGLPFPAAATTSRRASRPRRSSTGCWGSTCWRPRASTSPAPRSASA